MAFRPQQLPVPLTLLLFLGALPAFPQAVPTFETDVKPFLTKNCYGCHNAKLRTADVDFTKFTTDASAESGTELWEKALGKLQAGEMPPHPLPRPKQSELEAVEQWMQTAITRADERAKPDPGRIAAHRLNRVEYNNTVRDLLGIDIRPADDFPQDDSGYGFDNVSDVLTLSPVLMERYLNAADHVVHTALFGPEKLKPIVSRHQPPSPKFPLLMVPPADYDRTGLSMPNALHAMHRFPVTGDYRVRVALEGRRPAGSEPVHLAVWLDGKQVDALDVDEPSDGGSIDLFGRQRECRIHVPAGEHWLAASVLRIYEGLPPSYHGPNPSSRPEPVPNPVKYMKVAPGATPEQIVQARAAAEAKIAKNRVAANRVYIHYLEVVGPYDEDTQPSAESRKLIFVCGHKQQHNARCPRLILSRFTNRAFRRPVTDADVRPYLDLYMESRRQGASFDEAIGTALQAVLVSPDFLFRIEPSAPVRPLPASLRPVSFDGKPLDADAQPISDFALASRLSYFLWSTMPDDELMRCAGRHTLHQPEVLKEQVLRMLHDPRSSALAENFAGQWLELRRLESVHPDHDKFPQFDNYLRMSMRKETEMFFDDMVRNDHSILDMLDSKTTFMNQKLAEFYGIPGVHGAEFRKVSLEGTGRAGVLTQASIMTVSSYATRTSPVLRGKWIMENFLNTPIPPPPANVPRFDESKVGLKASIRQQMESHRANPLCASCHSKMDPLGFAFENYNAIGQWRDKDGKWDIDASGKLPDGRTFRGSQELEAIFRKQPDKFAECVTEKLLTYALGRGLERYDRPTIKDIVLRTSSEDYRFSALVLEIVNSMPFRMRKGDTGTL